jgi:hypothetical protein
MISEAHTREMCTNLVLMGKDLHFADTHDSFQSDDDFLLYETTGNLYGVWVDISARRNKPVARSSISPTASLSQPDCVSQASSPHVHHLSLHT